MAARLPDHPLDRNIAALLHHAYEPVTATPAFRAQLLQCLAAVPPRPRLRLPRLTAAALVLLTLAAAVLLSWPRGTVDPAALGTGFFLADSGAPMAAGSRVRVASAAAGPTRLRSQTGAVVELLPGSELQVLPPEPPLSGPVVNGLISHGTATAQVRAGHLRCVTVARGAAGPDRNEPYPGPAIRLYVGSSRILPEATACEFEVLLASDLNVATQDLWFLDPDKLVAGAVAVVVHSGRLSFDAAGTEVELAGGEALLHAPGSVGSERFSWRDPRGAKTPAIQSRNIGPTRTEAGGTIRGRVQAGGDAVPHALVELVGLTDGDDGAGLPARDGRVPCEGKRRRAATRSLKTDDGGGFAFRGVDPGRYYLRASDGQHAQLHDQVLTLDPAHALLERTLELRPGLLVQGMVVAMPAGLPIPEASVTLTPRGAGPGLRDALVMASASDGRFTLRGVPPGRYQLQVAAPGFAPRELDCLAAEAGFLRVELLPLQTLRGHVVRAADQQPVTAFTIVVEDRDQPEAMAPMATLQVHSADGSFAVPDLVPGNYRIHALAPGFSRGDTLAEWPVTARPPEVRLELTEGTRVQGRVLDGRTGQPIANARVWCEQDFPPLASVDELQGESWQHGQANIVETDVFGRFALEHVRAGAIHVVASHADYAMARMAMTAPPAARSELEVRLWAGASFAGSIGGPARAWRVFLEPRDPGRPQGVFAKYRVDSRPDGTWRLDHVAPGAYTLICAPGDGNANPEDVDIQFAVAEVGRTTMVDFHPQAQGASLRVEVVDAQGRPQSGLTLYCLRRAAAGTAQPGADTLCRSTDSDGIVTFRGLTPGEQTALYLDVANDAGAVLLAHCRILAAGSEPTRARVVLGNSSLSGAVLRRGDQAPVAGAQVQLFTRNPLAAEPRLLWAGRMAAGLDGRFTFRSLPPGEYYACAHSDQLGHELTPLLPLAHGQHLQFAPLLLGAAGTVQFRVLDADGRPVDGAAIQVLDEEQRRVGVAGLAMTIQGGTLVSRGFRPGTYTATALSHGRMTPAVRFQVRAADTTEVVLREP